MTKKINSRNKGKVGELEFSKLLSSFGFHSRRGQQFSGGSDSPDIVCESLPEIHWEVKRVEKGNPYKWLSQAIGDSGQHKIPIVAHRKSYEEWIAIMRISDLLQLLKDAKEIKEDNKSMESTLYDYFKKS